MTDDAARDELRFLTRALRAHLEWQAGTGATGLERADLAAPPAPVPLQAAVESSGGARLHASDVGNAPLGMVSVVPVSAASAARAPSDAKLRLQVLADTVKSCALCGLSAHRQQTVFARGDGSSGVCFVGEGPGADEDAQGLPFVGKAGQLLDRMIEAMGLSRDAVYVCNVVKCRPPENRKPEPEEMAACLPYLSEQLELIAPRVIVALGATAVQGLFGTTEGITRLRGKWQSFRGKIDVMPTFHPAYLLRNPAAKREVWEDLQEVLRHIGRSAPARR